MLILGIDTGGTYTDGVIVERETKRVLCTAKALTTQNDLTIGMENCMRALPFDRWEEIGLVSLSTTLATNAIVEGRGCRVGLVVMGKMPAGQLPAEVCVTLNARVDIRGGVRERLAQGELHEALLRLCGRCDAVAVSGYASVRNPAHELQAARAADALLGLPVVCGHQLTGALGFYERTVTAVLNARLIPIIRDLIATVCRVMTRFGIDAPVMVVRGDGSLMRADYAGERPVETVLSGPAASVIGARFLSGREDCVVVDMGGTTTDIACLKNGVCALSDEGARLAGWRTRVRALEICTYGLGGDSEIKIGRDGRAEIGPRRVLPLCRARDGAQDAGLTPTDLLHITGEYRRWNTARAMRGAADEAARCARTPEALVASLRAGVAERLAAYCRDGMAAFGAPHAAVLVGVGAPARIWLADAAKRLGLRAAVPPYAEVANAVGAAVGEIRETAWTLVRPNKLGSSYFVYTETERQRADDLEQAEERALRAAREAAARKARRAGAAVFQITESRQRVEDETGELIELRLRATACGDPQ
ncbi:hydantoinase/oxoprolinase family protein [Butyricicoccus faecihominis]|uniref:hydantoinase/oxoprolinase family protein n=1 Tax=Butyricicoccus faecihominis TaxID=1712515 RepID=UPI00247AFC43|nr:hydantoinase/oxoprolinase family protein [Butyricicoccus faecihominis]MCQ5131267.1 hydantoinase/oxoprolinase family protein [Butyricicoccus faecihominis]